MRYRKGMIALSETRDYPLLRRVLHSGFVTPVQLHQFMKLDYCVSSRNAFDNRLRRLLHHDLLVRHEIPTMNRGVVYSISRAGASELVGRGEYYSGSTDIGKESNGHVQHALELNTPRRGSWLESRVAPAAREPATVVAGCRTHYATTRSSPAS